jgi:hypothetical protein
MNWFFLLVLLLLAFGIYFIKTIIFKRFQKINPTDIRKTASFDGHECWATVEVEVDNFLMSIKVPHQKPEDAEEGEYFSNSLGVPNFVIYKPSIPFFQDIDSIIVISDMERPIKKFAPIKITPEIKPQYPCLYLKMIDLLDKGWQKKGYKFFKKLRKEIQDWAAKEKKKFEKKKITEKNTKQ